MESPISDIFTTCVFNNIMEVTFIFPPRVFSLPEHQKQTNCFIFIDMHFCKILAVQS